jgi:hypothetical protein
MRRFLRLLTLWLLALALPLQGAAAATAMAGHAGASTPSQAMVMPDGTTMDAAAMAAPCHRHGNLDKAGCGACCGPLLAQQALPTVAPVAARRATLPRPAARAPATVFLTGGTDRPPRPFLA